MPQIEFSFLKHQIWAIGWEIRGQKAKYVYTKILLDWPINIEGKFDPLNFIRWTPKRYKIFKTCIKMVSAFDCSIIVPLSEKLELRKQNLPITILHQGYKDRFCCLSSNFSLSGTSMLKSKAKTIFRHVLKSL